MNLVISDKGNLGVALAAACGTEVSHSWFIDAEAKGEGIGVYVGRGSRYEAFHHFCAKNRMPILQCSSDVDVHSWTGIWGTQVFDVPNAAEAVMVFLEQMETLAAELKRRKISVDWFLTESHQAAKTSPARTALRLAELLGIPPQKIQSIRRKPDFHAYHILQGIMGDGNESLEYICRVEGLEPYARGIIKLAENLTREMRESGRRTGGLYEASHIRQY